MTTVRTETPGSTDQAGDRADLDGLRRGDDAALDRLVARWQRPLLAFAIRYLRNAADAKDVVSETFARLYQHRRRLAPESNVRAWLFTTLTNQCHNLARWRRRHPGASAAEVSLAPSDIGASATPNLALQQRESTAALLEAVGALRHDLRTTLLLHYFEGLSYREIGVVSRCAEKGVESRLYRARQQLRTRLSLRD